MWNQKMKPHGFLIGFVCVLGFSLLFGTALLITNTLKQSKAEQLNREEWVQPVVAKETAFVTLQKNFVCGTKAEKTITQTISSIDELRMKYADWKLVSEKDQHYIFKKKVNDLAPACKENGYFGLLNDEILALFQGLPEQEQVIQTFFQVNTEKFESGMYQNDLNLLKEGIRIQNLAEYNSILSTYGELSDETLSSHQMDVVGEQ